MNVSPGVAVSMDRVIFNFIDTALMALIHTKKYESIQGLTESLILDPKSPPNFDHFTVPSKESPHHTEVCVMGNSFEGLWTNWIRSLYQDAFPKFG